MDAVPATPADANLTGIPRILSWRADLMTEHLLQAAAAHQAGRAVVGSVWGFNITKTRIYQVPLPGAQDGIGYTGYTSYGPSRVRWAAGFAHLAAAGTVAGRLHLSKIGLFDDALAAGLNGSRDFERAEEELALVGFVMHRGPVPADVSGASWEGVMAQLEPVVQQLWPQIEQVAAELLTTYDVPGDRVRSIIGDAANTIDLAALADASRTPPEAKDLASPMPASSFDSLLARVQEITAESRECAAQLTEHSPPAAHHRQPLQQPQRAQDPPQQPGVHPPAGTDGYRAR